MKTKEKIISIVFIFIFTGCAGLGIGNKAQSEFDKGLKLFNQSKYIEAIPYFVKATELDSDYYNAYLYLGISYINSQQYINALNPLRSAYRVSPQKAKGEVINILVDALFSVGLSSLKKGDLTEFTYYINEIIELKGNTSQAKAEITSRLIDFGRKELSDGNISTSIQTFKSAIELSPDNFEAYLGLANAYFKDGEILKAISNAGKALQINPDNQDAISIYNSLKR